MSRNAYFAISVSALLTAGALAQQASPISGQWTVGGPVFNEAGQDRVQLTIRRGGLRGEMSNSSPIGLSQLRGLARAQLDSSGSVVRFELVRDAGTVQFQGYVQNGNGGGAFTFAPNPNFAGEMRSLGYNSLSDEAVFTMAVHDVSGAYVRDLNALGIHPESADQLVTMRIHNVTIEYVRDFKALGFSDLPPEKLVTMRIHGVTPDFARELKGLGYNSVSTDQMVTMRIHQVTPDYIRKTRSLGMGNLPIDQLVSLRIHGIVD